jgi:hypothetical protein
VALKSAKTFLYSKGGEKNGKQKTVGRNAGIRDKSDIVKLFNVNYYI